MKRLRIIMVIVTVALASAGMGQIGCGGGQLPFGGEPGKVLEELGVTTAPPEEGGPVAPVIKPGDVAVPIVTEKKETPPAERPGIPCLMNYALTLNPEYVLVIKSNEAILGVMGLIDFQLFSLVLDDPSIVDDLLAYADELVVAGGSQGTVALVRIKGELIESGKGEQDFEGLLNKLKLVIRAALNRRATETGIPIPENDTVIYSSFTNDPSAYVVGLSSTLAKLVNQTADVECNYCTIGACGTQNIPMLYLSMQGSAFYKWLQEMFPSREVKTESLAKAPSAPLEQSFGAARFVMGLDVNVEKAASAYAALFDSAECTQDSLLAAISVYLNVTKGFGQRLLNAVLAGVLESSQPEVKEVGVESTPADLSAQIAQLQQEIEDLRVLYGQTRDSRYLDEMNAKIAQLNTLLEQQGLPPYGEEQASEPSIPQDRMALELQLKDLYTQLSAAKAAGDAAAIASLQEQIDALEEQLQNMDNAGSEPSESGEGTAYIEPEPSMAIPQTKGDTSGTFGTSPTIAPIKPIQMERLRLLEPRK